MLSTRSKPFKRNHVKAIAGSLLDGLAVVDLEGPQAEAFAQAQTMNDVLGLAEGRWHWSGWLTPKGRVDALFALARPRAGHLRLVLLDADPVDFTTRLSRFLLRTRATLRHREDLAAYGVFGAGDSGGGRDGVLEDGEAMGLDLSTEGGTRRLWIAPRIGGADPDASARWRDEDLRHGLPRRRRGDEPRWTPHMLSLDRLKAFSVRKGCYPGQEIVARTHFLGQAKRRTWWADGESLGTDTPLTDGTGAPVADVVGATRDGRGALVVGALDEAVPVFANGRPVRLAEPLAGLARPI
ncbi:MAG: YgfZ/GcvT domain-containing protein [Lysobacteraceae bacterium]|jgi:folate-binding protein YgfZ|nr:folate-binding protein [Silanimonas sp.]